MSPHVLFATLLFAAPALARSGPELVASGTPEAKAQALLAEIAARNAGWADFTGEVEMDLEDPSGGKAHRAFTVKALEKGAGGDGDRSLIVFTAPADVKRTALLSHAHGEGDDEQWLYLPASRRVKRVSTSNRGGAFAGSEFSFEDLTASDARKYAWRYAGEQPCGASRCLALEATPKAAGSAYSRRVLLVDADELRAQRVDLYDRKGQLWKTLAYADYVPIGGRFYRARAWSMKNVQSGKATTLRFANMKVGSHYTAADFQPEKLGN